MAIYSYVIYTVVNPADNDFVVAFPYIAKAHVKVLVNGQPVAFTWLTNALVEVPQELLHAGDSVRIERHTPIAEPLVNYAAGADLTKANLDKSQLQSLFVAQESWDSLTGQMQPDPAGNWDALGHRVVNVATPVAPTDAATKEYADATMNQSAASAAASEASRLLSEAARDTAITAKDGAVTAAANAELARAAAVVAKDAAEAAVGQIPTFGATGLSMASAATPAAGRSVLGLKGAAVLDVGTGAGTVCAGDDARLDAAREDTLARDNAAMNAFLAWLSAERASGPIPKGYAWTLKTDEWSKTAAVYDADGDFYANYSIQHLTHALAADYSGWTGVHTIVQKIPQSALTINGTSISVEFTASTATPLPLVDVYVGHAAAIGDPYNFASAPVRLTFSGSNGATIPAGGTLTSDVAVFPLDETKDLLVAITINSSAIRATTTAGSGYATYWKTGADAGTINKTGYTVSPSYPITSVSAMTINSAVTNMSIYGFASLGYVPTTATIYILHKAVDAVNLNTDIKVASSRISGWANATDLTTLCTYDSTYKLLKATVDVSALGSGTYGYAKVETYNGKRQKVRAALAWFE